MIKVFIPADKTQGKTKITGLWLNDSHKLFVDKLSLQVYKEDSINLNGFYKHLDNLKRFYRQEAIFYCNDFNGFIYYNRNKIEVLNNRIEYNLKHVKIGIIKDLLKRFNGLTVYREQGNYKIVIYYN